VKVVRCAQLNLPFDLAAAQQEVSALPDRWRAHFQQLHYNGGWTALPLRSPGGRIDDIVPSTLGRPNESHSNTPLLAHCPAIAELLRSLECPLQSVRLLNLQRGATIHPHRDIELAFEQGEARLHFPIITNPSVEFFIDEQRVTMEAGSAWYINANLIHRVTNRGDADRIHLVVDCQVDDWLRGQFSRAQVFHSEIRRDPKMLREMIEHLRIMNTPTSLRLVAELEEELSGAH
jgi:hypothetical protein